MARTAGSATRSHRVSGARQRAWNMIRLFKRFTADQIAAPAEISVANLQKYLKALAASGYLILARPKQNGKTMGHAVWQFVRNTGPRCPIVRNDQSGVYDPNQDRLYPYPALTKESADEPATAVSDSAHSEASADVRKLA
jgi:hypothetical protein